ncbi:MAG TPA: hypothetical protein VK657_00025 [Terriglobales bacterium]|nr:hypothetical protein [Terriglobales bacterium]
MKIEYTLKFRRRAPAFKTKPASEPQERPHRIARILALAHRLDELVRSGAVRDHEELARLGHVSPARICQFMTLLHLAPAIQEYLLFLTTAETIPVTEHALRKIAREPRWDRQRAVFKSLLLRK